MNTANLQLEGLYLAVSAINRLLIDKGLVTRDELDLVLHRAEAVARGDERSDDLSPANRDAIAFSIRLLRVANREDLSGEHPTFSELARMVGERKEPYNDQM